VEGTDGGEGGLVWGVRWEGGGDGGGGSGWERVECNMMNEVYGIMHYMLWLSVECSQNCHRIHLSE